jgi:DNA-binding NarL/FixJ family response regulator
MKRLHDAGHPVPFVLVTADARDAHCWLAMGVSGVVDKCDLELDLVPAVLAAASGRSHLSRRVRRF